MTLKIDKEHHGRTLTLTFTGILDISTAHVLNEEELLHNPDQPFDTILLDFCELEFIDSTGVGSIMEIIYFSKDHDKSLQFRGLNDLNREIFETVGVLHLLNEFKGEVV